MNNAKVKGISIPKLKNDYRADYRDVRFSDRAEYCAVTCLDGGYDLSAGGKVDVMVKSMRDCNPMSLDRDNWTYFPDYLCVSEEEDDGSFEASSDGCFSYEFYRASVSEEGTETKPYSDIYLRTRDRFTVGESYVFCYRKVN